jgi:hypothetical protein
VAYTINQGHLYIKLREVLPTMPIHSRWETDYFLHRVMSADVTPEELVRNALICSGDARFEQVKYILNDYRKVCKSITDVLTEAAMTQYRNIGNVLAEVNPSVRNAILLTREQTHPAIIQHVKTYQKEALWATKIFSDESVARAWLAKHNRMLN